MMAMMAVAAKAPCGALIPAPSMMHSVFSGSFKESHDDDWDGSDLSKDVPSNNINKNRPPQQQQQQSNEAVVPVPSAPPPTNAASPCLSTTAASAAPAAAAASASPGKGMSQKHDSCSSSSDKAPARDDAEHFSFLVGEGVSSEGMEVKLQAHRAQRTALGRSRSGAVQHVEDASMQVSVLDAVCEQTVLAQPLHDKQQQQQQQSSAAVSHAAAAPPPPPVSAFAVSSSPPAAAAAACVGDGDDSPDEVWRLPLSSTADPALFKLTPELTVAAGALVRQLQGQGGKVQGRGRANRSSCPMY